MKVKCPRCNNVRDYYERSGRTQIRCRKNGCSASLTRRHEVKE